MENHHDRKIKKLVSDRGETPEHNGFAKRANHTVLEKACCLLNHSNLPNWYWEEAVNNSVFLSNLSPTASRGNKSPHFLWTNSSFKLAKLQTFGCQAIVHSLKRQWDWKLAPSAQEGVLLGFENGNMAYQILRLSDLKVAVTRNVTFNKKVFPIIAGGKQSPTWSIEDEYTNQGSSLLTEPAGNSASADTETVENQHSDHSEVPEDSFIEFVSTLNSPTLPSVNNHLMNREDSSDQQQPRTNNRTHCLKVIGPPEPTLITSNVDSIHILPYSRRAKTSIMISTTVPRTYWLALQCEDKEKWTNA
ncbi:hypothetical protein O181_032437 [Austropuccinia psidii MF-1]|uniref:Retroviral polymerase SH3-like domain-containing protein n=1 Tax=Austropuccinia psidii MF-1 TaxID=1389203 RepID=A0A9Q3D2L2_9BASI|nr:hypothetical protein [Austropuccinia psidii MF-1]